MTCPERENLQEKEQAANLKCKKAVDLHDSAWSRLDDEWNEAIFALNAHIARCLICSNSR